jgi:hypothetical protein
MATENTEDAEPESLFGVFGVLGGYQRRVERRSGHS